MIGLTLPELLSSDEGSEGQRTSKSVATWSEISFGGIKGSICIGLGACVGIVFFAERGISFRSDPGRISVLTRARASETTCYASYRYLHTMHEVAITWSQFHLMWKRGVDRLLEFPVFEKVVSTLVLEDLNNWNGVFFRPKNVLEYRL